MSVEFTLPQCPYCGNCHIGICSWVKSIEYYSTGAIKRVELHERQTVEALQSSSETRQEGEYFAVMHGQRSCELKTSARKLAFNRGHCLGEWQDELRWNRVYSAVKCVNCHMVIVINTSPIGDEHSISGDAATTYCLDAAEKFVPVVTRA